MRLAGTLLLSLSLLACTSDDDGGSDDAPTPDAMVDGLPEGELCLDDAECADGLTCRERTCQAPGGENAACDDLLDCEVGLDCLDDRRCHATGGEGEPCSFGVACDQGLLCTEGSCRTTIRARFCHCLTNTFGDVYRYDFTIGGVSFPTIATQECSACQDIPTGDLVYTLHNIDSASPPMERTVTIEPGLPDMAIFGKPGGAIAGYEQSCDSLPPGCL